MDCAKGDQPLGGDLHAILDKIEADVTPKYEQIKPKAYRLTSGILQQKHSSYKQMPVLHQSKYISKTGPSSLRRVWAEYKDEVPDVSDYHQNIGTSCNSKLKLPNLKISVSKLQKDY